MRYPQAIWKPWKYGPQPTYYRGQNKPEAVVLHIAAGWSRTIENWAAAGYYGASWHYTVCLNGEVWQHLEHTDGGYQAGIEDSQARKYPPTWRLWKGLGKNVNLYTLGIEHEGFPGNPMPQAQRDASYDLCRWLAKSLRVPLDVDHFPAHAAIDLVNRKNDFNTPSLRTDYYAGLMEEEEDMARLDELEAKVNLLLRNVYGEMGDVYASQIKAEERSLEQDRAMRQSELPGLAVRLQGHIEDQESHS